MPKRIILFVALISLAASGPAAYWLGSSLNPRKPEPVFQVVEGLAIDAVLLELGDVWEESDYSRDLPLQNQTDHDIEISGFSLSCGCSSITPEKVTVPAGTASSVRLHIDLTKRQPSEIGMPVRPLTVQFAPIIAPGWPKGPGWKMSGVIRSRATLETMTVHFGERVVEGEEGPTRKVVAHLCEPGLRLETAVEGPKVVRIDVRSTGSRDERTEVLITPLSSLPLGRFETKAVFSVISATGDRLPGPTLLIEGVVQPAIRPLPSQLVLGSHAVGQTASATLVLQGSTTIPITVQQIELESPDVRVEPTMGDGTHPGRTFRVTQKITKEGDQTSTARFVLHKPGQPPITVSVAITYRGNPPTESPKNGKPMP